MRRSKEEEEEEEEEETFAFLIFLEIKKKRFLKVEEGTMLNKWLFFKLMGVYGEKVI